jgi:glycosyltransferase involved in cell wall biosynthesis
MAQPLVSVVLCCYNGDQFLKEQIDSILAQTYKPLELIISDDASTDGTREILKRYENDPSVKIFYQAENLGLSKNFDFAASQASGKFIAFSDQDDIWLPAKIGKLVDAINGYPLVYSDSLLIDEKGKSLDKKLSDLKKMYTGDDSRGYVLYSCVWGHGMLITKELFQKTEPTPHDIHHDIWLAYQAFLNGGIKFLDEVLTHYRQHSSSSSITIPKKQNTRKNSERFNDYQKKLAWIKLMQQYERPAYQPFYKKLVRLYEKKREQYVFGLVTFMLRNRTIFFMFSKKNFFSQLIEIIKQGRREQL